jgi:hypothetical protein
MKYHGSNLLGALVDANGNSIGEPPSLLNVVALLADRPGDGLARGQVGTIVEALPEDTLLVEFSDNEGRPYAVVPCANADLLVLHYQPQAS